MAFSASRLIVHHVPGGLRFEVSAEVRHQFRGAEFLAHSRTDDGSRSALLIALWGQGSDQVWIEQDTVPPPGSIGRLLLCAQPWCGHRSWIGRHYEPATTSLVKLSAQLRREQPRLAFDALAGKSWLSVDQLLRRALESRGHRWHEHTPPSLHLHDYAGLDGLSDDPQRLS